MSQSGMEVPEEEEPGPVLDQGGKLGVAEGLKDGETEPESASLGSVDIGSSSNGRVDGRGGNESQAEMQLVGDPGTSQSEVLQMSNPNAVDSVQNGSKIEVSAPVVEKPRSCDKLNNPPVQNDLSSHMATEPLEPTTIVDPDALSAVPITVIANCRSKLTMRHIHIENEYDSNIIRQTKAYVKKYQDILVVEHTSLNSAKMPSRFYRHLLEYVKNEKIIDEIMDTIEMLKSQVNQRVKDAWIIGTTVDRQQRDTLDNNEETVEASIKYMEASMPPGNRAKLEAALTALRRCRTTDLLKAVKDRQYAVLWVEQEINSCDDADSFLEMFRNGTVFLRSLSTTLTSQKHVSAAPLLGNDGSWQCRAAHRIVQWIRHIAAWLLRFGNRNSHLELAVSLTYMPGIACHTSNEKIGYRPLLGIIQIFHHRGVPNNDSKNRTSETLITKDDLEIPVYNGASAPLTHNTLPDNNGNEERSMLAWVRDDDLLDYFLKLVTAIFHCHNGISVQNPHPDIFNNNIITTAKRMVSSIEADNEKRAGESSSPPVPQSQFYSQLGIFDVGTGSGTQKTSWYLIETTNDEDHLCKGQYANGSSAAGGNKMAINMADDDMVAIFEQLPMYIVCKALFHHSRIESNIELAFARAATLIKIFGQGLFDFGENFPGFCKLVANAIVNIVTEATTRINPTDEAGALIESLCLLTIHELQRSPARQVRLYLTRLPYHKCSPDLMWRVLIAIYLGTESQKIRSAYIDGTNEDSFDMGSGHNVETTCFMKAVSTGIQDYDTWVQTLNENSEIREIFHKCLGETDTFNECARLATLADIAESHGGDIARVVFHELFLASHVAEDARMIWYNQIVSHMVTICHSHPQLLSHAVQLAHCCVSKALALRNTYSAVDTSIFENIPLKSIVVLIKRLSPCVSKWYACHSDFSIFRVWMTPSLVPSMSIDQLKDIYVYSREMVEIMINNMNWGSDRKCEQLFLSVEIHRECAVLLSEAMHFANNLSKLENENASNFSKLAKWWSNDIDVFKEWAMGHLLKLCLCNNYIESFYPRIMLNVDIQGRKEDANIIYRTKLLWHTLCDGSKVGSSKTAVENLDGPNVASSEALLSGEGEAPTNTTALDPIGAYTLLLISDVLNTPRGWHFWESLVDQGYLQAAIRILHDLSPILYRSLDVKSRLPLKTLETICRSNDGTLFGNIDYVLSIPYGTRAFASMVASQCEYGCMWLDVCTRAMMGDHGFLYLLEKILEAGVEHAIHNHMLILDETIEWITTHMIAKVGQDVAILDMLRTNGLVPFFGSHTVLDTLWGLLGTDARTNTNCETSSDVPHAPSYPHLSFFMLLVETFKQRNLYALLCQHYDSISTAKPDDVDSLDQAKFVEAVCKSKPIEKCNQAATTYVIEGSKGTTMSDLNIFQWAKACIECSENHCLLPLMWQVFFALLMTQLKDATASSMLGKWLVDGSNNLQSKLASRLLELIQYFGNDGIKDALCADQAENKATSSVRRTSNATKVRRATVTNLAPTLVLHAKQMESLFKSMYHWLSNIDHVTCQNIHRLPELYSPGRLALFVMSANPLCEHHESICNVFKCLWWDTLDTFHKYKKEHYKSNESKPILSAYFGIRWGDGVCIDWMPYSRNTSNNSIVLVRQRKDRLLFNDYEPDSPPKYTRVEPIIYNTSEINLRGMEPDVYTNELVDLAKRFSKSFSDAMDMDTQVVNCVQHLWMRKSRQMRKRANDSKGRTYEFVFNFKDSVFNKQRLAKARSFATICDQVTRSLARSEMSPVAVRKDQHDRVSVNGANENEFSTPETSSTMISMMTIEVVVEYLEKQAFLQTYQDETNLDLFYVDCVSKWFYRMLHCDQDHESWTRKCEYTRDFIWNIIKRLAHLWLSTNPSSEERNNLLAMLTKAIPSSATNENQGIVFIAIMGILQDILRLHFDDHLPFVLRVLVGTDGLPMNVRVWESIALITKCWEFLMNPAECCRMLGVGMNEVRIRRRDNKIATLSREQYELVNDLYEVWDGRVIEQYLVISQKLFSRCEELQLKRGSHGGGFDVSSLFASFRCLFNPWAATITLPADETHNRRAIVQHPWSLNGSMKDKVRKFLRSCFGIANSCNNEAFSFFLWEWVVEMCTPLEYVAADICTVAIEYINWERMMLGKSEIDKILAVVKSHATANNTIHKKENFCRLWVVKMTSHMLRKVNWKLWSLRLIDATETDEVLKSLLALLLFLQDEGIPQTIPWKKISLRQFNDFITSRKSLLFVKHASNVIARVASMATLSHFGIYLEAVGEPLMSLNNTETIDDNEIINEQYFCILSHALFLARQMAQNIIQDDDVGCNNLSLTILRWVDITVLPQGGLEAGGQGPVTAEARDTKHDLQKNAPMSKRLGKVLWDFIGDCGTFSEFILANAPSAVLSIVNLVKVYERALWSHVRCNKVGLNSKRAQIVIPSLSSKEFIFACIENGCSLTLYRAIFQFDALDTGHVYENWKADSYEVISSWVQQLPAILDTRIVPLAYALIKRGFDSLGDRGNENIDALRILMERSSPSLMARLATFVSSRGRKQLQFCWSSDCEKCRLCVQSIFQEMQEQCIHIEQDSSGVGNNGDFEKAMGDFIDKLWTEIVKGPDGETCELRNDVRWLVDFFQENHQCARQ